MNAEEIPVSIEDTILVLSRAAQVGNGHNLSEVTLVGGQALNFWADRYFGSREDFVSGDIDLLGGTAEALRCAKAWEAKINVADMDSAMGSPNTAVVLIDRGYGNPPLRVDFLGNLIGPSVRDVLKARFEVLAKQGFSFHVMHPLHIMESRIGNAFYLGRKDELALNRLELSFSVIKTHIQNVMAQDTRSGLKLVERVVDVILSERGKMAWHSGHDPMQAIPHPDEMSEYPLLFSEKRWPQILSDVAAKRTAYASTIQQIEEFNRQRLKNAVQNDGGTTEKEMSIGRYPAQGPPHSDNAIHQQLSQSNGKLDMFAARMESFNNHPEIKATRENAAKYGMPASAKIHETLDQNLALKEQFLSIHKMFHEHIQPAMDKHAELVSQLTDPQQQQDAYHALNARSHRLMDAPKDWPDRNKVMMTENATSNPDNAGFEAQNSSSMGMVIAYIMQKLRNNLFDKSPKANTTNTTNNDSAQTTAQPHPTKKKRPGGTP